MTTKDAEKANTSQTQEVEGWRPEPGDVLSGKVVQIEKGWSDYTDSFYPIVTIQKDDGTNVNLHCFHEILKERLLDVRPVIGDKLEVECLGEGKTKDGKRSYVSYRVTVPGETGARVWESLASQDTGRGRSGKPSQPRQESLDDIPF